MSGKQILSITATSGFPEGAIWTGDFCSDANQSPGIVPGDFFDFTHFP
jgi:hypothetical protein